MTAFYGSGFCLYRNKWTVPRADFTALSAVAMKRREIMTCCAAAIVDRPRASSASTSCSSATARARSGRRGRPPVPTTGTGTLGEQFTPFGEFFIGDLGYVNIYDAAVSPSAIAAPEPDDFALLLAGLALLGFAGTGRLA